MCSRHIKETIVYDEKENRHRYLYIVLEGRKVVKATESKKEALKLLDISTV